MPKQKLSPQEKKELQAKKKAEQAKAQVEIDIFRRNAELEREIKYGTEAVRRQEQHWHSMLERIALPQMRTELEYTWHVFERAIDSKDFTISLLLDELKDADSQYEQKFKAHIDDIERMVTLYFDQINDLWRESRKAIMGLYEAATMERSSIQIIVREHEDFLKTILFSQADDEKASCKMDRGAYLAQIEIENNKIMDSNARYILDMKDIWLALWNEAEAFTEEHRAHFAERRVHYDKLYAQEEAVSKYIKRMWRTIEASYSQIKSLNTHFLERTTEHNHDLSYFSAEANFYDDIFRRQQKIVKEERLIDEENLSILVLKCNEIMEELKVVEAHGLKLIRIANLCRKLETQHEKTLMFPAFDIPGLTKPSAKSRNLDFDDEQPNEELHEKIERYLKLFWNRLGQVEVSRFKLQEEQRELKAENQRLRMRLYKYCECVNCEPKLQFLYENYKPKHSNEMYAQKQCHFF